MRATRVDLGGGGIQGVATPPNGQSHSIKWSTTNVLRYAQALIYITKSLVVVVVSCKRVVKPLSRLAVVQPEVLHLLECLLGCRTVQGEVIRWGVVLIKWAWPNFFVHICTYNPTF